MTLFIHFGFVFSMCRILRYIKLLYNYKNWLIRDVLEWKLFQSHKDAHKRLYFVCHVLNINYDLEILLKMLWLYYVCGPNIIKFQSQNVMISKTLFIFLHASYAVP